MTSPIFSRCDHCGALAHHEVVKVEIKEYKGKFWRVGIAKCSACGKEFEAYWVKD